MKKKRSSKGYIPKIKEGEVYGYWTVVEVESASKIHCKCKCGQERIQRQTDLLRGVTTKCSKCHVRQLHPPMTIGLSFGDWTVIQTDDVQYMYDKKGRVSERKWHCRCKCGSEKWIRTSHLNGGLTRSCPKCSNLKRRRGKVGEIPLIDIDRAIYGAKKRKYEWSISNSYLWTLFLKQERKCALSGVELDFSEHGIGKVGSKYISTASLDRIDSSKGYVKDNVQWVHKDINKMKNDLSEKAFINWCKLIVKNTTR